MAARRTRWAARSTARRHLRAVDAWAHLRPRHAHRPAVPDRRRHADDHGAVQRHPRRREVHAAYTARCALRVACGSSAGGARLGAGHAAARALGAGRRAVRRPGRFSSRRSSRWAACSTASRCAATRSSRSRRRATVHRTSADDGAAVRRSAARSSRIRWSSAFASTQQLYLDAFYDAGNIWARPQDFNPTRLFRGAGFGGAIVTPLGPLGLDLGYGFDRTDAKGVKTPGWQLHFKFGQIF